MNPYQLNLSVIQHIDALVKQSKLSRTKRDDIKRELTAFAEDYGRELHFEGKDATEIDLLVIAAIGTPEQRGKEFTIANQKFSRIPFIGPLFYEPVLRGGLVAAFLHGALTIALLALGQFAYQIIFSIENRVFLHTNSAHISTVDQIADAIVIHAPFLVAALCVSQLIALRYQKRKDKIDVLLISFFPYTLLFIYIGLSQNFGEYSYTTYYLEPLQFIIMYYVVPVCIGILIPTRYFQNMVSRLPFIRKFVSL